LAVLDQSKLFLKAAGDLLSFHVFRDLTLVEGALEFGKRDRVRIGVYPEGRCACKLAEVVREGEAERARIDLQMAASGDSEPGGPRVSFELKGELVFDLTARKIASLDLSGLATTKDLKRDPRSGATLKMDGAGPVKLAKKFAFESK